MSIKRTILQRLPIAELPGYESRLVRLDYPPGCKAPLHTHPVSATGIVLEGDVVSQWEGGDLEHHTAGDSFVDHGTKLHIRSDNANADRPLVMILSYVIRVDQPNVEMA